jgi:hypothetical protein
MMLDTAVGPQPERRCHLVGYHSWLKPKLGLCVTPSLISNKPGFCIDLFIMKFPLSLKNQAGHAALFQIKTPHAIGRCNYYCNTLLRGLSIYFYD